MIIGNEFRTAREALGLSREQISAATKIQLKKIAALEEDAFDRLPAGIYLDGIVSAYAREVGLDADALVQRVRAHVCTPSPETLEKIAAVREAHQHCVPELRLSVAHGMLAFAGVGLVLVAMTAVVPLFPRQVATEPRQTVAVAKTDPIATPIAEQIPLAAAEEVATSSFEPAEEPAGPQRVEPVAAEPRNVPPQRVAESIQIQVPAAPQAVAPPMHSVAVSDVDGAWTLETLVESSSLRTFQGLRLGYRLELRQRGSRIEGTGRKISENGVTLNGRRQTPIAVEGTIDRGRLKLTFGEYGARRPSTGTFDLVVKDPELLRGSFSSNAARSAGVVEARRL